ncbi:lactonase family protein [Novosphingobium sp. 9]|uniref:lactonase family protein n=1 Tax=Novosphingobium sp. 9 TaxID=2025349 RepID=UPI0021B65FE9|nr:lactonase family protein [Novosphingobium sp. 9]
METKHRMRFAVPLAALLLALQPAGAQGAAPAPVPQSCTDDACAKPQWVYIGSRHEGPGGGISVARFDPRTGTLTAFGHAAEVVQPTWLLPSPHRPVLYSVSEVGNDGKAHGAVLSFTADPETGKLTLLSRVDSGGGGATHLALGGMPPSLFVANYGTGQVAAIPLQRGGTLLPPTSVMTDTGSGPTPRQASPHAHAVLVDRDATHLLVGDLGADRIFVYRIDAQRHALSLASTPFLQLPPGSAPRHLALSVDGRFVYALTEFTSQLFTLAWDPAKETLRVAGSLRVVPAAKASTNSPAEILLSPDGRFAYVTNRGEDTVVVYALDPNSGLPTEIQRMPAGDGSPSSLAIDETGKWMLLANAAPGSVTVLARDPASGRLTATPARIAAPQAVSVALLKP